MVLWKYTLLPARDGHIHVIAAFCYIGAVHTITASLLWSPLVPDSLLQSLGESLIERAALQEK